MTARFRALLAMRCLPLAIAIAAAPTTAADVAVSAPEYAVTDSAVLSVPAPNGEAYRVFVSWPAGDAPAEGWPVLYLLDGEDVFAPAALTARRLARFAARTGVQDGVVVAIEAGELARRTRDYTPETGPHAIPVGAPAHGQPTGGADAFLDLLATRIKPMIAERWHVDPARETLAGHSFGGLLTLYTLAAMPDLFDRYAAVSPSFWYGEGLLLRHALAPRKDGGRSLVRILAGDAEGAALGSATSLTEFAKRVNAANDAASTRIFPGLNHGETMLAALPDIIATAFGNKP